MKKALLILCLFAVLYTVTMPQSSPSAKKSATITTNVTQDFRAIARKDATDAGIDATLFVRQINEESGFNPNVVSRAGAIGIAQFMPETARGLGVDPYNPVESLKAAALLMARYVARYGTYAMALAAYNAGPGTLVSALRRCGLSWRQCLPYETQGYIRVIMQA